MMEIFGHRWATAYGEAAEVDGQLTGCAETWGKGLAGITPQQIAAGLKTCITSSDPWPPTLPAFRGMCLEVPTLYRVEQALAAGETSPFLQLVRQRLDWYAYRQATAANAGRMLRAAYELAREHVMSGGELPEVLAPIEHEARKPAAPLSQADRERIKREMAELRRELGFDELEGRRDRVLLSAPSARH